MSIAFGDSNIPSILNLTFPYVCVADVFLLWTNRVGVPFVAFIPHCRIRVFNQCVRLFHTKCINSINKDGMLGG